MYVPRRDVLCRENERIRLLLEAVGLGSAPSVEPLQNEHPSVPVVNMV
jgi:hypothetical protein